MPTLLVDPRDHAGLRHQKATFKNLDDALTTLSRQMLDVFNTSQRIADWLAPEGEEYAELTAKLKTMGFGVRNNAYTVMRIAESFAEFWDIARALEIALYKPTSDFEDLSFGFPLDLIGAPPSDCDLGVSENG